MSYQVLTYFQISQLSLDAKYQLIAQAKNEISNLQRTLWESKSRLKDTNRK